MKYLKIVLLVAFSATLCYACGDDDNNFIPTYALNGTTWTATEQNEAIRSEYTLTFDKESFSLNMISSNKNSDDINADGTTTVKESHGSYCIKGNKVSLSMPHTSIQGTINGNTMYFPKTDQFNELTLYKANNNPNRSIEELP